MDVPIKRSQQRGGIARDTTMWGIWSTSGIAAALLAVMVVVLVLSSLKQGLLLDDSTWGLSHFRDILGHSRFWEISLNTVAVAVGSVVVMTVIAVPLAWVYARTDLPGKGLLAVFMTVQIAVPGFLVALAYVYLLNPANGLLNTWLSSQFGIEGPIFDIYGLRWIVLLQGLFMAPPAFFLMAPSFQGIDSSLEESAHVAGVSRFTVFLRVVVPLMRPTIVSTMVLYGVVSMALFDFAATIGVPGRTYVFSTWIFQLTQPNVGAPDYGGAAALGMVMVAVASIAVQLYFLSIRRASRFAVMTGRRGTQGLTSLGRVGKCVAWGGIAAYVSLTAFIPVAMLAWTSLLPFIQPPSASAFESISFDAYREAWVVTQEVVTNTTILAVGVPTITVFLAVSLAWLATRSRFRWRKLVDVYVMGSVGVPPIVAALAFLYFGLSIFRWVPVYGTIWLLVFAFVARYLSYAQRIISSSMLQVHGELEDAAFTAGVPKGKTLTHITAPLAASAMAFAWVRIGLLSIGQLTMALMLQRPGLETVSTKIWALQSGGRTNVAASMGVFMVLVITVVILVFESQQKRLQV